jgi:hypothetical protein
MITEEASLTLILTLTTVKPIGTHQHHIKIIFRKMLINFCLGQQQYRHTAAKSKAFDLKKSLSGNVSWIVIFALRVIIERILNNHLSTVFPPYHKYIL